MLRLRLPYLFSLLLAGLLTACPPPGRLGLPTSGGGGGGSDKQKSSSPGAGGMTATITASVIRGVAPLSVQFDAAKSIDPEGDAIFGYNWDYGDGETAPTGSIVTQHTYAQPGTYQASLVVETKSGTRSPPATLSITVLAEADKSKGNLPPVAAARAEPRMGIVPFKTTLHADGSTDPDGGQVVGYQWDLGDGNNAEGVQVEHTFSQPGNHRVRLTVADDKGATASTEITVAVRSDQPINGERDSVQVFYIGNSHTDSIVYSKMAKTSKAAGKQMPRYGLRNIPGAPLQWIWDNQSSSNGQCYTKPDGGELQQCRGQQLSVPLGNFRWDAVTLQPYDRTLDSDINYAGLMLDNALAGNPDVQLYIYTFFPRIDAIKGTWLHQYNGDTTANTSKAFFDALAKGISEKHPNAKPVLIIPSNLAFMKMRERILAGQVPGLSSEKDLYVSSSNGHVNAIGTYILATTVYATLYHTDPRAFPLGDYAQPSQEHAENRTQVSEQVAAIVREVVYEALKECPNDGVDLP